MELKRRINVILVTLVMKLRMEYATKLVLIPQHLNQIIVRRRLARANLVQRVALRLIMLQHVKLVIMDGR